MTDIVTHLRHKWCLHSVLPLAPRAKQPALHMDHVCSTQHTVHWAVELDRFPLAAGGGERSGPNMLLWLLFSFMLGLRGGWGKHCVV
jgi:hypothetical protein